jgi:zona occludens toxin (predicted ATPase)
VRELDDRLGLGGFITAHLSDSRRGNNTQLPWQTCSASLAAAYQLLVIVFYVVRDGSVYQELSQSQYEQQNKPKATRRLLERLQKLGYYLTLQPMERNLL